MIGKALKKSKTLSHIDLDKPIIKSNYYPPLKSANFSEPTEAGKAKFGHHKTATVPEIKYTNIVKGKNNAIEELSESGSVKNSEKDVKAGQNAVNDKSKQQSESNKRKSDVSDKHVSAAMIKPRDMRKSVGTAADGEGSYEYDNKFFKYEGQWKNGKKHGTGRLVFLDGSYYEGTFHNGEIEGFGTRYFKATGCKYQGQFSRGELHGKGRMVWPDGSIYEGQWVNNKRQGFGIMKSTKANSLYKGAYHNNKRQGQGIMIYPLSCLKKPHRDGGRYEGGWENDNRHGEGDMRYVDGTVYEGHFEDDDFSGEGTMRHCSGLIYHGNWLNGMPTTLPTKLVIINATGKEPLEYIQGQAFDVEVKCVNDNGDIVEEDSRRELRITAGFKHVKAKKGTALFDLIEEYEEKPMETPYYEVLQYPLTDFILEEDEPNEDEDLKEENQDTIDEERVLLRDSSKTGEEEEDNVLASTQQSEDLKLEEGKGGTPPAVTPAGEQTAGEQPPGIERRQSNIVPETPMSGITSVTPASMLESQVSEKDSRPLPPPVANKRSDKGHCEWRNIQLAQAPPRFPPFVALDEEERKLRARQQKQVEAKRLNQVAQDERFARIGEYVLMVHDVTNPPFMGKTLEPAFILVKLKKPKREKKPKEVKPKWDTSKHITEGMTRT